MVFCANCARVWSPWGCSPRYSCCMLDRVNRCRFYSCLRCGTYHQLFFFHFVVENLVVYEQVGVHIGLFYHLFFVFEQLEVLLRQGAWLPRGYKRLSCLVNRGHCLLLFFSLPSVWGEFFLLHRGASVDEKKEKLPPRCVT